MQLNPSFFQTLSQNPTTQILTSLSQEMFQVSRNMSNMSMGAKLNQISTLGSVKTLQQRIVQERQARASMEDPMVQERTNKLLSMDNLADITLAGFAIKLIRLNGPMAFKDLAFEVSKCYDALRRSDGSKYTGNYIKALKGCLSSSDVFSERAGNIWAIEEVKAQLYEQITTQKIKEAVKKQTCKSKKGDKDISMTDDDARSTSTNNPLKRALPSGCNKVFDTLDSVCKAFRAEGKTQFYNSENFNELRGEEAPLQLLRNWGKERLTGVLQCFDFFAPVLKDYMRLKAVEEQKHNQINRNITFDDFIGSNNSHHINNDLPQISDSSILESYNSPNTL